MVQISKLALLRFTELLESEYGERGITPIAYDPGAVKTEMSDKLPKEAKGTVVVDGKAVRVGAGKTLALEGGNHKITVS